MKNARIKPYYLSEENIALCINCINPTLALLDRQTGIDRAIGNI